MADERRDQIARGLDQVRGRIEAAAVESGRDATGVTLVVVTKTWPLSDLRILHDLGVRDFGENRHQEAEEKAAELSDLDINWHFIGQIQSNKAARIPAYAAVVHSVDSSRLAQRLNSGAHRFDGSLDCFVQVNLAGEAGGGVDDDQVLEVTRAIDECGRLRLVGVMGIAPLGGDAVAAYARLAEHSRQVASQHPDATAISAGMSDDLEAAVMAGATHVRVGSAVLGRRPSLG